MSIRIRISYIRCLIFQYSNIFNFICSFSVHNHLPLILIHKSQILYSLPIYFILQSSIYSSYHIFKSSLGFFYRANILAFSVKIADFEKMSESAACTICSFFHVCSTSLGFIITSPYVISKKLSKPIKMNLHNPKP